MAKSATAPETNSARLARLQADESRVTAEIQSLREQIAQAEGKIANERKTVDELNLQSSEVHSLISAGKQKLERYHEILASVQGAEGRIRDFEKRVREATAEIDRLNLQLIDLSQKIFGAHVCAEADALSEKGMSAAARIHKGLLGVLKDLADYRDVAIKLEHTARIAGNNFANGAADSMQASTDSTRALQKMGEFLFVGAITRAEVELCAGGFELDGGIIFPIRSLRHPKSQK